MASFGRRGARSILVRRRSPPGRPGIRLAGAFCPGRRQQLHIEFEYHFNVVHPARTCQGTSIDQQQFVATVPSYAVLGTNYTVRVVIQSSVDIVVPIIVQMSAPVGAIFFHPRVVRMSIPPMGFMVANFTILPFAPPHTRPYNVTALLFVFFPLSMSSPLLVDQVTATVSTIGPNPFPYLEVVVIFSGSGDPCLDCGVLPRHLSQGSFWVLLDDSNYQLALGLLPLSWANWENCWETWNCRSGWLPT